MIFNLQKAGFWKRIAAWMLDAILVCLLATGVAFVCSAVFDFNGHYAVLDAGYAQYEEKYGISFDLPYEEYVALDEEQKANWDAAYEALRTDEQVLRSYEMVINLSLLMTTLSILISVMVVEFFIPLIWGNGQTVGKKIFSLCLMRTDGVKANTLQLLTRALLGKTTVETLVPAYLALMFFWGTGGAVVLGFLTLLMIVQVICVAATKTKSAIHDLMAGTVVVDATSQLIFDSTEELIAHYKKLAAERAAKQKY